MKFQAQGKGQSIKVQQKSGIRCSLVASASVEKKKILMMGGTRFIGIYLARLLTEAGHEVGLHVN